jgi:hypothetical protein
MSIELVVVHPFADYATGDRITDTKAVAAALKDHPHRVVPVKPEAEKK